MITSFLRAKNAILLLALSTALFAMLIFLHKGLYPTVFSDEWLYSSSSRLLPIAESIVPSYLYLAIFKTTNYCGMHFLECARVGNVFFYILALPFIYFITRRVCSEPLALFISFISLLGPFSSYTSYFMPESFYFFSFWFFSWLVLSNTNQSDWIIGIGTGLILCVMSFIKIHAIFLLAASGLFYLWTFNLKQACRIIIGMLLTFLSLRFLFGWLIAGTHGFDLIGLKYHYNAISLLNLDRFLAIIPIFIIPLIGNIAVLCLLFNVPIILFLTKNSALISIKKYTICCLIILITITSLTTAQIVGWNSYETIDRLHLRYYNFTFVMFYIIAAANLTTTKIKLTFSSWLLIISVTLITLASSFYLPYLYRLSFIDCPEIFGFFYQPFCLKTLILLSLSCLVVWLIRPQWGISLYIFLYFPLALLTTNYFVHQAIYQTRYHFTDVYDRAGQFIRSYLGKEVDQLMVIGPDKMGLYKVLFYLDNSHVPINQVSSIDTPIELMPIPSDRKWLLLIGNYPMLHQPTFQLTMPGYKLIKL